MRVKRSTLKAAGWILVVGSIMTLIPSYHFVAIQRSSSDTKSRNVESSTSVQQQQQQRQRHLKEACSASNDTWSDPEKRFAVSHDLRVVFCVVGKAACTSWLRVLLQLTGNPAAQYVAATDRHSVHGMFESYLEYIPLRNATLLASSPYKDYFKFMFVREPLERLVSAYRDKMFRTPEWLPLRKYIVGRFRRHPSPRSLERADDVKFEEFVRNVLQEARRGQLHLDTHWRPQYDLCRPCQINYDFIGHYETLHQDAQHVLRLISHRRLTNNTDPVQFPATELDNRNRNSREFLGKFYDEIPSYNIRRLLLLYKRDYEVFGYEIPDTVVRQKLNDLSQ